MWYCRRPAPHQAFSMREAEREIIKKPGVWKLRLCERDANAYTDIDGAVIESFRGTLLKYDVKTLVLHKLTVSTSLLNGLTGTPIKDLTIRKGTLVASLEEVDTMIGSLSGLEKLTLNDLTDAMMYSNLHACFKQFRGRLSLSFMTLRPVPFARLFLSSKITGIDISISTIFRSEIDKKRFFRSLSFCQVLKYANLGELSADSIFAERKNLGNGKDENRFGLLVKIKVSERTRRYLLATSFPATMQELSVLLVRKKLSKVAFKALAGSFSVFSLESIWKELNK